MNTARRPLGTGPDHHSPAAGAELAPRAQLAAERLPTTPAAATDPPLEPVRANSRRTLGTGPAAH